MSGKLACLTIDDGPVRKTIEQIDFLNSRGIKAIWTCRGELIEKFEDRTMYMIRHGHIIGNHSYDHPDFSEIGPEEARHQIEKTDLLIDKVYEKAGVTRPMKIFRFPGLNNGSNDDNWNDDHVMAVQNILRKLGYRQPRFEGINYEWYKKAGLKDCLNVDCTYATNDSWLHPLEDSEIDLEMVLKRMDEDIPEPRILEDGTEVWGGKGLNYSGSNEIVMMHAFIPFDAFKAIIEKMLGKGLRFVLPKSD